MVLVGLTCLILAISSGCSGNLKVMGILETEKGIHRQ